MFETLESRQLMSVSLLPPTIAITAPKPGSTVSLSPQPLPPGGTVSLNPQPLPPGGKVSLNPQPLPPGAAKVTLNPQPLPPKVAFGSVLI